MTRYTSGNKLNLKLGIESFSEDLLTLDVIGNSNIGGDINVSAGNSITAPEYYGDGSNLTGITLNQVSDAIGGITVQEEGVDVGTTNGIININFVSSNLTATGSGIGATITLTDTPSFTTISGDLTGNASTATQLENSINFSVSGDVATASDVSFDGTGDVGLAVTLSNNFSANTSGIITASEFYGDGSNLTNLTAGQVGALAGVTIREEGTLEGSAGSVGDINFVGNYMTATASGAGATITLSDISLGTDTIGNYVATISGTANEIEVTNGSSAGSTPTIGLPNNVTISNDLSVSGNLNVTGTLTYEDVTNVDSIGIVTARSGIDAEGDINVSAGNSITAPEYYGDGSGLTGLTATQVGAMAELVSDTAPELGGDLDLNNFDITGTGNINITGVITATSFSGDGSNLTGLTATQVGAMADLASDTAPDLGGDLNLNSNDITGNGNININGSITATSFVGTASTATTITISSNNDSTAYRVPYTSSTSGNVSLYVDNSDGMTYNPGTNTLSAGSFSGNGSNLTNVNADTLDTLNSTQFLRSDTASEITAPLTIDSDNNQNGALRIENIVSNTNNDFYFAQEISQTLSGSQVATADREQGGIYMDINSTATGGDTSNEHRAYGIYIDLDSTGDADVVNGLYVNATATPTTGTTSNVWAGYFFSEDNGGAGAVTNVYGVQAFAHSDNSNSDTNNQYGGYFKSYCAADSAAVGSANGVYAEIEINGTTDLYGSCYAFRAEIDNNTNVAQTNTSYLLYGNYSGTLPTTAYGVYINNNVPSYFGGGIEIPNGPGTIAGSNFNAGWLRIGTSSLGWAFDNNELITFGSCIVGSASGSTITVSARPAFNGGTSGSSSPFTVDSTQVVTNLNADLLDGQNLDANANVNTVVSRDGAADINCRLLRPNYGNNNYINGALAFRTNNSSDNYVRFCNDTSAIRTFIGVTGTANIQQSLARIAGWVPAYSDATESNVVWNFTEDAVEIKNASDNTGGAAYKAMRMKSGDKVRIALQLKGSVADSNGVYIRIYFYNGNLPDGKTHVSNSATYTLVQEDSSGDTGWWENNGITTSYVGFERTYTAPADGYMSIVVLNWSGYAGSIYLKAPDIQFESLASAPTAADSQKKAIIAAKIFGRG